MRKKLLILIPCLLLVAAAALCLLHFRPCEGSRFSRRGGEDEFLLAFHPLNGVLEDVYTLAEGDQIDVRIAREKQEQKLERERQNRDENRREFEKNLLATSNAALALGEATARAVQRIPDAHCNGDMHAALNYAAKIKHEQRDFLAAQGIDNIF